MQFKIWKKKTKPRNYDWFAWYPVIAKDAEDNRYLVWWEKVFKVRSAPGCVSYMRYGKEGHYGSI